MNKSKEIFKYFKNKQKMNLKNMKIMKFKQQYQKNNQ